MNLCLLKRHAELQEERREVLISASVYVPEQSLRKSFIHISSRESKVGYFAHSGHFLHHFLQLPLKSLKIIQNELDSSWVEDVKWTVKIWDQAT